MTPQTGIFSRPNIVFASVTVWLYIQLHLHNQLAHPLSQCWAVFRPDVAVQSFLSGVSARSSHGIGGGKKVQVAQRSRAIDKWGRLRSGNLEKPNFFPSEKKSPGKQSETMIMSICSLSEEGFYVSASIVSSVNEQHTAVTSESFCRPPAGRAVIPRCIARADEHDHEAVTRPLTVRPLHSPARSGGSTTAGGGLAESRLLRASQAKVPRMRLASRCPADFTPPPPADKSTSRLYPPLSHWALSG